MLHWVLECEGIGPGKFLKSHCKIQSKMLRLWLNNECDETFDVSFGYNSFCISPECTHLKQYHSVTDTHEKRQKGRGMFWCISCLNLPELPGELQVQESLWTWSLWCFGGRQRDRGTCSSCRSDPKLSVVPSHRAAPNSWMNHSSCSNSGLWLLPSGLNQSGLFDFIFFPGWVFCLNEQQTVRPSEQLSYLAGCSRSAVLGRRGTTKGLAAQFCRKSN